jgi:hypothetical protein
MRNRCVHASVGTFVGGCVDTHLGRVPRLGLLPTTAHLNRTLSSVTAGAGLPPTSVLRSRVPFTFLHRPGAPWRRWHSSGSRLPEDGPPGAMRCHLPLHQFPAALPWDSLGGTFPLMALTPPPVLQTIASFVTGPPFLHQVFWVSRCAVSGGQTTGRRCQWCHRRLRFIPTP